MATSLGRLAIPAISAGLALTAGESVSANVLIQVDKPTQTMTVSADGATLYRWSVSTGSKGYSTPGGSFAPFRMEAQHFSKEWDNAAMPHSIFFTQRGHSIHGTDHTGLGTPVSHGCIRLSLQNAATLYQLVQAEGLAKTKVVVSGSDPTGSVARDRRSLPGPEDGYGAGNYPYGFGWRRGPIWPQPRGRFGWY